MSKTPTKVAIDFGAVEVLRKKLYLTKASMAELLGTSRVSYNAWERGKSMRKSSDERVRSTLILLLDIHSNWIKPEHNALDQHALLKKMKQELKRLQS